MSTEYYLQGDSVLFAHRYAATKRIQLPDSEDSCTITIPQLHIKMSYKEFNCLDEHEKIVEHSPDNNYGQWESIWDWYQEMIDFGCDIQFESEVTEG